MLEKNDLAGDSLKIVPRQYLPLISRGELLRKETFGSTGKCLEVYWSKEDYMRSMYSLWYYRKKYYGVTPADKRCSFDTMKGQDDQTGYERIFGIRNLTETRLVEIYREMMEYEPVWLILQPSIAELLCIVKHKHHLPWIPSLRYVEMTGEELSGSLKRQMIRSFRCLVANRYSSTEVNCIAYECPYGNLHCMEDNVRVEIIDEYGRYMKERGKLENNTVVTTVMSNFGLYKAFDEQGIGYAKTAVGDKYVYENMSKTGNCLGGEQSGHIIFSKYATTGDGILTSLKIMEVMLEKKETLGTLASEVTILPQLLKNVRVADKAAALNDPDVQAAGKAVDEALGNDGRLLLRQSGTEPLIRVMVEAETPEICEKYVDQVIDVLKKKGHVTES